MEEVRRESSGSENRLTVKGLIIRIFGYFFLLAIFAGVWYVSMMFLVSYHESVHQNIFEDYNISSFVEINYEFPFNDYDALGVTIANRTIYEERCNSNCILANEYNDAIGYHFTALLYASGILGLLILTLWYIGKVNPRRQNVKQFIKIEKHYYMD